MSTFALLGFIILVSGLVALNILTKMYVAPSKKYIGNGLFTKHSLSPNSYLDVTGYLHKMNDADFEYPKDFSYKELCRTFKKYTSLCNSVPIRDKSHKFNIVKISKNVPKDGELTRRYGLGKWCKWLMLHVWGVYPFTKSPYKMLHFYKNNNKLEDCLSNYENLERAAKKFGHNLNINADTVQKWVKKRTSVNFLDIFEVN